MRSPLRSLFRRLPPVARRDERIARLTRRLDKERQRLVQNPSYQVRLNEERRLRALEEELGAPSRSVIAGGKFGVYDLMRSHGIDVPQQYGQWADPADIPWDELPDAVVVKAAFGAASHGVFPLHRADGGWRIAAREDVVTGEQLAADLAALVEAGRVRPPFGAEEYLDGGNGRSPVDVKVYSFYGEAPLALLRRVGDHGDGSSAAFRVVDRHGTDLVDWYPDRPTDPTIPLPGALAEVFDVAERISTIIKAPFSRIDLYDLGDRIVFGEVTPRPGSPGWFGAELDAVLGSAWERAQVRLWRDIAGGMSPVPERGPGQA